MDIDQFFNSSSFSITPLEKEPPIVPDETFTAHLFIYDCLSMHTADSIAAKYYLKKGRNKTYLDESNFTISQVGGKTWKLEGSIPSSDWDSNQEFGIEAEIAYTSPQSINSKALVDQVLVGG